MRDLWIWRFTEDLVVALVEFSDGWLGWMAYKLARMAITYSTACWRLSEEGLVQRSVVTSWRGYQWIRRIVQALCWILTYLSRGIWKEWTCVELWY
jgi:hypothetical protein